MLCLFLLPLAGSPTLAARGRILLIIDDMGHPINVNRVEACFALPDEVAFSIIPGTPQARGLAQRCARDGRDYLAHLPWTPLNATLPVERLLMPLHADGEHLQRTLAEVRRELPLMVAANNHQGSRACLDAGFLAAFAKAWQSTGLPFLDSRTVAGSRVPRELGAAGIPVFENRLFLDHVDTDEAILGELHNLERLARAGETVIAIAHPRPRSLRLLKDWLARLPAELTLTRAREVLIPAPRHWLAQRGAAPPATRLPGPDEGPGAYRAMPLMED